MKMHCGLVLGSGTVALALLAATARAAPIVAYNGTGATAGRLAGVLNIGRQFNVSGSGITVHDLGVWDNAGDGLANSHTVTLFINTSGMGTTTTASPITGGSTLVPSGTTASLNSGFRFSSLASPLFLAAGNYSVVLYGMNVSGGDAFGNGGGFPSGGNVTDIRYDPFQFTTNTSPAYPGPGDANNHSSASFDYDLGNTTPEPGSLALIGLGLLPLLTRRRKACEARQA